MVWEYGYELIRMVHQLFHLRGAQTVRHDDGPKGVGSGMDLEQHMGYVV
ncbi:MAG: hypothetical protein HN842_02415 [Gammaproteobacteria bacterium]|nr:hypothetical protein [Gammaproteobacteria bacterium]